MKNNFIVARLAVKEKYVSCTLMMANFFECNKYNVMLKMVVLTQKLLTIIYTCIGCCLVSFCTFNMVLDLTRYPTCAVLETSSHCFSAASYVP